MSAEVLRRAAVLMRERAAQCPEDMTTASDLEGWACDGGLIVEFDQRAARHFASWHPAVALAVADWLDEVARRRGPNDVPWPHETAALAVARAYLGESS